MTEEDIIKTINVNLDKIKSLCTDDCINKSFVIDPLEYALKCLLDLYNKEKEKNKGLNATLTLVNIGLEEYISKDKIRELRQKLSIIADNEYNKYKKSTTSFVNICGICADIDELLGETDEKL